MLAVSVTRQGSQACLYILVIATHKRTMLYGVEEECAATNPGHKLFFLRMFCG